MNATKLTGSAVALLAIVAVVFLSVRLLPNQADESTVAESAAEELIIKLHPAELAATGITVERATVQRVRSIRTLPGRIVYDQTKHVAVRAAANGVIGSVDVNPGDVVAAGQILAVLRCPAIGTARSEMLSKQSALDLAEKERDWRSGICDGAKMLVELIRDGQSVEEIEATVDQERLGQYRAELLNAYSQKLLAEELVQSAAQAGGNGVLSGRVINQRKNDLQQSTAKLAALIEQTLFESQQVCKEAEAKAEAAKRLVQVAQQELASLLGAPIEQTEPVPIGGPGSDLSRLVVRSPIQGTIETREYSATERVSAGDELFVVADTSHLWVEADIRGGDWSALQLSEGDEVSVTTTGTGTSRMRAKVRYLGRQVDPQSGSVPLVAELDNEASNLRPGLFARIEAPTSQAVEALVVPESSIVDVDGIATIYVPKEDGFRPIAVTTGRTFGSLIEILKPIQEGQSYVATGAFFLKSEQLLSGEE